MPKFFTVLMLLPFLFGCATPRIFATKYEKKKHPIKSVCILKNKYVEIEELLPIIIKELKGREIESKVFDKIPKCEYNLVYEAETGWDFGTYLSSAVITIHKEGSIVMSGTYYQSSTSLKKWGSIEEKLKPVFREMFDEANPSTKD